MKHINVYIDNKIEDKVLNEGLIQWLKAFIKKITNNQKKLIDRNGKVKMLDMDTNKLVYEKEPVQLSELLKDKNALDMWNNNKIGYPESFKIIKNIKKYTQDLGDIKSDPYIYTFYYKGENTYSAGVIIYEKNIQYIENYKHIISIESNLIVDNPSEVQEAIFNQFKTLIEEKFPSNIGFTAKLTHNKMKGIITKLGFKVSEDNNEIYKVEE